jgi:alpha/beta superfamily hydrolase
MLSLFTDFEDFSTFAPAESHIAELHAQVDQVVRWARALQPLRAVEEEAAA